jgi:sugar phosphate permease
MVRKVSVPTRVLILLCLMYFITYIDRVNISTAGHVIQSDFKLSNTEFGQIFSAFAIPYLIIQFFGGAIADRFGPRRTLFACALIWAGATILTGFADGLAFLYACRLLVGVGEGASFATASRAIQTYLPNAKRGFAQGLTHACARFGNAATPPLIALLIGWLSWRGAFIVDGTFSLIWGLVWFFLYRDDPMTHPAITDEDLATLPPPTVRLARKDIPWRALFLRLLPVTLTYFCYGWTLWMLLSWLPNYFQHGFGLDLKGSGFYSSTVFVAGVIGDGLGGWVSDWLVRRSGSLKTARVTLICLSFLGAAASLGLMQTTKDLTMITACLAAAFFFLELSIGAFWAMPGDIAPAYSGTASGLMNVGSALAAVISPPIFGAIVDKTGDWNVPFYGSIGLLLLGIVVAQFMHPDHPFSRPASASSA